MDFYLQANNSYNRLEEEFKAKEYIFKLEILLSF